MKLETNVPGEILFQGGNGYWFTIERCGDKLKGVEFSKDQHQLLSKHALFWTQVHCLQSITIMDWIPHGPNPKVPNTWSSQISYPPFLLPHLFYFLIFVCDGGWGVGWGQFELWTKFCFLVKQKARCWHANSIPFLDFTHTRNTRMTHTSTTILPSILTDSI